MSATENVNLVVAEISRRLSKLPVQNVPSLRPVRREVSRTVRPWSASGVQRLAEVTIRLPNVPRWFAYELISKHAAALNALDAAKLRRLGRGMAAWHEVDPFGCELSGPAWRNGQVENELIHGWARSKDRWWRRAALVSTISLSR